MNLNVIVVGYGNIPKTKVKGFKVRNCMGANWGLNGYIWIQLTGNMCGLCHFFDYV